LKRFKILIYKHLSLFISIERIFMQSKKSFFYLCAIAVLVLIFFLLSALTGCLSLSKLEKTTKELEELNRRFREGPIEETSAGVISLLDSLGVGDVENYPGSVYDNELNENLGEFRNQLIDIPGQYHNVLYMVRIAERSAEDVMHFYDSQMETIGWEKDFQLDSEKGYFALWQKEGYEGIKVEFIVITGDIDYEKRNETVILTGFVIHEQAKDKISQGKSEDEEDFTTPGTVYFENPGVTEGEGLLLTNPLSMGIEGWEKWLQGEGNNTVTLKDDPLFAKVVEFNRQHSLNDGGAAGIYQLTDIDLKRFSSVKVWLIGKVLDEDGGNIANVNKSYFPEGAVQVRIKYLDESNAEKEWYHGFFYSNIIYYDKLNFSLVTKDKWFWYESPNLLALIDRPLIIKEVRVYGFGWNFTGQVAEVNLIGS
jgi:hypothetical protein